jgi:DNA-directed RNA polymerase beta' subunit
MECLDYSRQRHQKVFITLGLQVQSVVSAKYFLHKGDSRIYIELSGIELDARVSSSLFFKQSYKLINALCPQLHRVAVNNTRFWVSKLK